MEVSLISPKLISRFERYSKRVRQGTVNNNLNISIFGIALQVKARDAAKFFLDKSDMWVRSFFFARTGSWSTLHSIFIIKADTKYKDEK